MTAEQWKGWVMELRESRKENGMPGTFFLLSDNAIAWLAQRLYDRQEREIAELIMEGVEYGPRS